jgi:hypothetical protein
MCKLCLHFTIKPSFVFWIKHIVMNEYLFHLSYTMINMRSDLQLSSMISTILDLSPSLIFQLLTKCQFSVGYIDLTKSCHLSSLPDTFYEALVRIQLFGKVFDL